MENMGETMNYNLLEDEWIPVLWKDGKTGRVGTIKALEYAGEIQCITLANPLDLFAAHRFILTLLYWKADRANGVKQVRESLLKDEKIPTDLLDDIKKERGFFDLFDSNRPFLQDTSVCDNKEKKSVGSLFAELATGTNMAHFHHGDDENMRLCMRCVTLGMLRVVPWSQAGGAGLTPSVHNAPPIMAIATGYNLAVTLGLNLVPLSVKEGVANWSGHFKPTDPTKPIPYLEALTWNPRRICLPAPEENEGICWRCGQSVVRLVGKIVYKKNKDTKLSKKDGKSMPFEWQDPSAFYPPDEYKTIKSYSEVMAMDNKDLNLLLEKDTGKKKRKRPQSIVVENVVEKNIDHQGWYLIIPCTNPANNKTFDHRQIELSKITPESIQTLIPDDRPSEVQGFDGWKEPELSPPNGIKHFVQASVKLLTFNDWAALSNAAFREMHYSPAAFDVLSGLYWGLRDKRITGLPSRNVAWLMLKLMATVPAPVRVIHSDAKFNPLQSLPKRQTNKRDRRFPYPVSFPRGPRLEASLRGALDNNLRKRHPKPVDWIGLCHSLGQLLN